MAYRLTTPLAAGVTAALLAGPAMAGQDAAFGGEAALSDEALGAQRAFGTTDDPDIVVGSNNQGDAKNNRVCNNRCTVNGKKTENNVTVNNDGDDLDTAGTSVVTGNSVSIGGNNNPINKMTNTTLRNAKGVATAIQNNGHSAAISVSTDVTITDTSM